MLVRLIFLGLVVFAVTTAYRWWRASRRLEAKGLLNAVEINQMLKLAESSKRMEAALLMRAKIVEQATKANLATFAEKVDPVIRSLARQVELREGIGTILEETDEEQLEAQIRSTDAEARGSKDDAERIIAETKHQQLETQLAHVRSLRKQRQELNEAGDRIIRELQNLHLALVNASATEAKAAVEGGDVQSCLAHLQEATTELQRKSDAEEEVTALIRKAHHARGQTHS
jgi:hypothetical protein